MGSAWRFQIQSLGKTRESHLYATLETSGICELVLSTKQRNVILMSLKNIPMPENPYSTKVSFVIAPPQEKTHVMNN